MARLTKNYKVESEGRDKGKLFVLTEMPASQAEAWAMRALIALMGGGEDGKGVEVPEGFDRMGMAAMAEIGLKALGGLKYEAAAPLLAEMFGCVQIMVVPLKPETIRPLIEDDIEEVLTRFELRKEVWELHAGFLRAVAPSLFGKSAASARKKSTLNT